MTGRLVPRRTHFTTIIGIGIALLASACSEAPDPVSETPVDLEPGRYEISRSGAGLVKIDEEKAPETICVRSYETEAFPHKIAQLSHFTLPNCTKEALPREGNKISGNIRCAADQKLADGANRFAYTGVVARDHVKVDVQMKFEAAVKEEAMTKAEAMQLKMAMKAMERMRFIVEANRTGEC